MRPKSADKPREPEKYFSEEGYTKLTQLLLKIKNGNRQAEEEFTSIVFPGFVEKQIARAIENFEQYDEWDEKLGSKLDYETAYEKALTIYVNTLQHSRESLHGWRAFATRFSSSYSSAIKTFENSIANEESRQSGLRHLAIVADSQATPREIVDKHEEKIFLAKAKAALSDVHLKILELSQEGKTGEEIAKAVGLSTSNVNVTLRQIERNLRRHVSSEMNYIAVDEAFIPDRAMAGIKNAARKGLVSVDGETREVLEKALNNEVSFNFERRAYKLFVLGYERQEVWVKCKSEFSTKKTGEDSFDVSKEDLAILNNKLGDNWADRIKNREPIKTGKILVSYDR